MSNPDCVKQPFVFGRVLFQPLFGFPGALQAIPKGHARIAVINERVMTRQAVEFVHERSGERQHR